MDAAVTEMDVVERDFLTWVQALTGFEPDRVQEARARLRQLAVGHVTAELVEPLDVDSAVGAVYLAQSLEALEAAGVPASKLRAKLRSDPEVWPTWAEIRAAEAVLGTAEGATGIILDVGRGKGRSADFQLALDGGRVAIEFKALGLSDQEAAFCQRVTPFLRSIRPRRGIATVHTPIATETLRLNRDERRHTARQAEALATNLPRNMRELSATVVVAHATEPMYLARLRERFEEALAQLPRNQPAWLAFHWSNGAPLRLIRAALGEITIPDHVAGVLLLGAVVLTPGWQVHNFILAQYSPFHLDGEMEFRSAVDDELAEVILAAAERSASVRPTVIRAPVAGRPSEILLRDGRRRILPFNLLLSPDPEPAGAAFGGR